MIAADVAAPPAVAVWITLAGAAGVVLKGLYSVFSGWFSGRHVERTDDEASMSRLNERLDSDNEKLRILLDRRDVKIEAAESKIDELNAQVATLRIRIAELLAEVAQLSERVAKFERDKQR